MERGLPGERIIIMNNMIHISNMYENKIIKSNMLYINYLTYCFFV